MTIDDDEDFGPPPPPLASDEIELHGAEATERHDHYSTIEVQDMADKIAVMSRMEEDVVVSEVPPSSSSSHHQDGSTSELAVTTVMDTPLGLGPSPASPVAGAPPVPLRFIPGQSQGGPDYAEVRRVQRRRTTVGASTQLSDGVVKVELDYAGGEVDEISSLLDMFFVRDGLVPLGNYTGFWARIEEPALSTFFLVALIAKLVALCTEEGVHAHDPISMLLPRFNVPPEPAPQPGGQPGSPDQAQKSTEKEKKSGWSFAKVALTLKGKKKPENEKEKAEKERLEKEKKAQKEKEKADKKAEKDSKAKGGPDAKADAKAGGSGSGGGGGGRGDTFRPRRVARAGQPVAGGDEDEGRPAVALPWPQINPDAAPAQVPMCVVNTIVFLSLMSRYDKDERSLRKAVTVCRELKGEMKQAIMVEEALDMLEKDPQLLKKLTTLLCDVAFHRGVSKVPPRPLNTSQFVGFHAFAYASLRSRCMTSTTSQGVVLNTILSILRTKGLPDCRLMATIHLLRQILSVSHIRGEGGLQTLKDIRKALERHFLLPEPIGSFAEAALVLVGQEIRAPGHTMRACFIRENPLLDAAGAGAGAGAAGGAGGSPAGPLGVSSSELLPSVSTGGQLLAGRGPPGRERHVPIFLDANLKLLEKLYSESEVSEDSHLAIKANLLMNMFCSAFHVDDESVLSLCSKGDIAHAYAEAMGVMAECQALPREEDTVALRANKLQPIYRLLLAKALGGAGAGAAGDFGGGAAAGGGGAGGAGVGGEGDGGAGVPSQVKRTPVPTAPSFHFEFSHFPETPLEVNEGFEPITPAHHYPTTPSANHLQQILSHYLDSRGQRRVVRIGVVGGNTCLHNVLCGYVGLMFRNPELFGAVDLQFFPIPWGAENTLSDFLASYDGWYALHIGALANSRTTSPHLSSLDTANLPKKALEKLGLHGSDSKNTTKTPVHVWLDAINGYFREAHYTTHIAVFRAELWATDSANSFAGGAHRPLVPFFCSVEIGKRAAADGFRVDQNLSESVTYKQVKTLKKFQFSPINLNIKFSEYSTAKSKTATKFSSLSKKWYKSISILNIPSVASKGSASPDPTAPALEFVAKEALSTTAAPMKKGMPAGKYRTQARELCASYLEIETEDEEPFDITVDGRYLGRFFKVRLEPCKNPLRHSTSKFITFPVQSFLPLSLE